MAGNRSPHGVNRERRRRVGLVEAGAGGPATAVIRRTPGDADDRAGKGRSPFRYRYRTLKQGFSHGHLEPGNRQTNVASPALLARWAVDSGWSRAHRAGVAGRRGPGKRAYPDLVSGAQPE